MIPKKRIPTRLVFPRERSPVVFEEAQPSSPLRSVALLYHLLLLGVVTLWLRLTLRLSPTTYARRVRRFLRRAGTVGIKLAQTLGMRSDLLPSAFAVELATLAEPGIVAPFAVVRQVIEKELGEPLESRFEEFSQSPFAAATSFQVHRALLRREGVWVAVKVLSPYAEETCTRDLAWLRRVTSWLRYFRIYPKMRWLDLFREVHEVSAREFDLRFEAAALRQLRRNLPPHGVYVPEVFTAHSSRRVLVTEFVHAALLADFIQMKHTDPDRLTAWLQENNIHPRKVARRLFHSVWRQILEDAFFHMHLHPGNVVLLRDSRLAILDCRGVGELEAEAQVKHRGFAESIADGEYSTAAEYCFLLASRLPLVDVEEVKAEMVRLWRRWENRNHVRELPASERSFTRMIDGLNRILYRYQFESQWPQARLARTLINAETSLLQLAPQVNYLCWLRQYFQRARRRRNRIGWKEARDRAAQTTASLLRLPRALSADSVAQQEVIRRQARAFRGSTSKSGYFLATLFSFGAMGVLLGGALLVCSFLRQHYDVALAPVLGRQLAALVDGVPRLGHATWLVVLVLVGYLYFRMDRARRAHLQQDVVHRPEARPAI